MLRRRAIQPAEKSSGFRAAPVAPCRPSEQGRACRKAKASSLRRAKPDAVQGRMSERRTENRRPGGRSARPRAVARCAACSVACTRARPRASHDVHAIATLARSGLLAAAKAEGPLIVYSSTNEQEGLPLFKLFTDATGIKVEYVRASDAVLMSRMAIEFRADQKSYDVVQTATINKMPAQMLAAYEPPEANDISPNARDANKRWYGVYANYNSPAYNTERVKVSELPGSYE